MNALLKLPTTPNMDKERIIANGRAVLEQESQALMQMAHELGDNFYQAVSMLSNHQLQRIIVTGMGKSGHVARKIAATFASTGSPAQFVHPAEASHGDLGMITDNDIVIAISNSGETRELSDILHHCRRFSIPIIAISGNADSSLAKMSDLALILGQSREVDDVTCAPTTSTTMTLALGDALAIALLKERGFNQDHFHLLHPGGKLGVQLAKAESIMHKDTDIPLVAKGTTMQKAIIAMAEKRFGCIGVFDKDNKFIGIITDGDIRRHMDKDFLTKKVEEIMTQSPYTIAPDHLLVDVLAQMNSKRIHSVFILQNQHAVGILHIHDILRAGLV